MNTVNKNPLNNNNQKEFENLKNEYKEKEALKFYSEVKEQHELYKDESKKDQFKIKYDKVYSELFKESKNLDNQLQNVNRKLNILQKAYLLKGLTLPTESTEPSKQSSFWNIFKRGGFKTKRRKRKNQTKCNFKCKRNISK